MLATSRTSQPPGKLSLRPLLMIIFTQNGQKLDLNVRALVKKKSLEPKLILSLSRYDVNTINTLSYFATRFVVPCSQDDGMLFVAFHHLYLQRPTSQGTLDHQSGFYVHSICILVGPMPNELFLLRQLKKKNRKYFSNFLNLKY